MGYFEERMSEIGATADNMKLKLWFYNEDMGKVSCPIDCFSADKEGNIKIPVYSINRELYQYPHPKATPDKPNIYNDREQTLEIIRFAVPLEYRDEQSGELRTKKYHYPKGCESKPYFPKLLLEAYEKRKPIKTLILTEGYFKSWVACLHGLPCVGLQSITSYKDKKSGAMYADIIQLVQACRVENIVMLYDGDCTNISDKALSKKTDLYQRPAQFIASIEAIRELFKDYDIDVYFACINSQTIENNPKGLDDLYKEQKGKEKAITEDILSLSRVSLYFTRINVKKTLTKVYAHFCTNNIESFYADHSEQIGFKEFLFKGTRYQYNTAKEKIEPILARDLNNFCRVGDDYYEMIQVPNKFGYTDSIMSRRLKGTIVDDFGKKAIEDIPKYKTFCNVPDHLNYRRVINDCYNLYSQFAYQYVDGECPYSLTFIKHIFGEKYVEMGLDYIQLLFQNPTEKLPVLCLVSKENKTGKSTFVKWLREIFGLNAIIVSTSDFDGDFNGHWVGKLLIMCEETMLEKDSHSEKIKALSTADTMTMNRKGRDHEQIEFFGKFILCSNREETFLKMGEHDERYWVLKVPQIQNLDPRFEDDLKAEIPHFLHYLNNRNLSVPQRLDRMWFKSTSYRTDAFDRVVNANRPKAEKELRIFLHDVFTEFEYFDIYNDEICYYMGRDWIFDDFFHRRYERSYINYILDNMPHETAKNKAAERVTKRCKVPRFVVHDDGSTTVETSTYCCKPFVFFAKDYITEIELNKLKVTKELDMVSIENTSIIESAF